MKNLNVSRDKFLSIDPKLGKDAKISLTKIYPNKVQHCPLRKKFENPFICIALLLSCIKWLYMKRLSLVNPYSVFACRKKPIEEHSRPQNFKSEKKQIIDWP